MSVEGSGGAYSSTFQNFLSSLEETGGCFFFFLNACLEVTKTPRRDYCFYNVGGLTAEEAKKDELGSRISQMLETYCGQCQGPNSKIPVQKLAELKVTKETIWHIKTR